MAVDPVQDVSPTCVCTCTTLLRAPGEDSAIVLSCSGVRISELQVEGEPSSILCDCPPGDWFGAEWCEGRKASGPGLPTSWTAPPSPGQVPSLGRRVLVFRGLSWWDAGRGNVCPLVFSLATRVLVRPE